MYPKSLDGAINIYGDYFEGPVDEKGRPHGKGMITYDDGSQYKI